MGDQDVFSLRLREARERKELTQKQLAELAKVTAASISAYEKINSAKSPSIDIAIQLAKALGVSLDWLVGISDRRSIECGSGAGRSPLTEYLSAIVSLADLGGTVEIVEEEGRIPTSEGMYWGTIPIARITFEQERIVEFCNGLRKMLAVCNDGTIDRRSFNDWLKGFLTRFDGYHVEVANPAGALRVVHDIPLPPPPPRPPAPPPAEVEFDEIVGDESLPF